MSKKETLEKFFKFMEKWRYEDFNAFENHFNKLMSMKSKEQLTNENEALKDSIAVILAQKKNVHKHCDEKDQQIDQLKQQLAEKDKEIKKLNRQLKDKDFTIKNLNHSLSVAPNANVGQRARIDELTKIVKEKDKEISKLQASCKSAISSFVRMETLYGIKSEKVDLLNEQLAEKDEEIESLKQQLEETNAGYDFTYEQSTEAIKELKQNQIQLAISELEKVKEDCFNQKELVDFGNVACFMVDIADILEIINNQIKELKGSK